MELKDIKGSLAKGAIFGYLRAGLAIPFYLLLTPFILHSLGEALFGVWAINTMVTGVFMVSDLGLKNSVIYHLAREQAGREEQQRFFRAALTFYALISPIIIAGISVSSPYVIEDILRVPPEYHDEAIFILIISAFSFAARFIAIPYQALIEAHQRVHVSQKIFLLWLIVNTFLTFLALLVSPTIYSIGLAGLISNLIVLIGFVGYARRKFAWMWVGGSPRIPRAELLSLLRYGSGIYLANVFFILREPLIKAIILREFGLTTLAAFEIVFRLCTQVTSIINTPLLGVFSAAAILRDRVEELGNIIRPLLAMTFAQFIPAVVIAFLFSEEFFSLWLGGAADKPAIYFPWVFLAFAVYYSSTALYRSIEAGGLSGYSGLVQFMVTVLTVGLIVIFKAYGEYIIPYLLLAGFSVFTLSNFYVFKQRFPSVRVLDGMQYFSLLAPPALVVIVAYDESLVDRLLYFMLFVLVYVYWNTKTRAIDLLRLLGLLKGLFGR